MNDGDACVSTLVCSLLAGAEGLEPSISWLTARRIANYATPHFSVRNLKEFRAKVKKKASIFRPSYEKSLVIPYFQDIKSF